MEGVIETGAVPAELRPDVQNWLDSLPAGASLPDAERARILKLVACSEFAAQTLRRDWDGFVTALPEFAEPPDFAVLDALVRELGAPGVEAQAASARLRRCRHRLFVHILWRDLHGLAALDDTLRALSIVADRLLEAAVAHARCSLAPRFGEVRGANGEVIPLVILGMGKLGGEELNFSSDIDLIFCYPEGGETDGRKCVDAQEYFTRLSQQVIALLDDVTADGFVFRIDTRLRPFGDSGPPVVSFAALESYLLQHGRDWERYAYVKARIVGPRPPASVADELFDGMIRPFVFRRYLDFGIFESLRDMQAMIAREVARRDLADNIKLGPGGIREAEFIVQALQLVRGGSETGLQERRFRAALPMLASSRGLSDEGAAALDAAYCFLRRVENAIQAIRDQQTHVLPSDGTDRARLCLALDFPDWPALLDELEQHRAAITAQFEAVALQGGGDTGSFSPQFRRLWETEAGEDAWQDAIAVTDSGDAAGIAAMIVAFAESGALRQLGARAEQRLQQLMPQLVSEVTKLSRPLPALKRCLDVIEQVLRRSSYIALLNESRTALVTFVRLCEKSAYIAAQLARHPVLLDELLDAQTWSAEVRRDDIAAELDERLQSETDSERRVQMLAQFQRASIFRIAVADFNGRLPIMKVSDGLTWLAEAVLEETLRLAWADLAARHGAPRCGFCIVGYGKLGGLEMSYGSDLDIVFLYDGSAADGQTDGDKPLDVRMFFSRLVRRIVHFLTTQTGSGELYEVDTRLRPDGQSGLLVTSLEGFAAYQEANAWTWEHQALLRARPVAGDAGVAAGFEAIRQATLTRRVRRDSLRDDVISMRARMRDTLDKSSGESFDLKHGRGGIGDIEFLVQFLVLRHAGERPSVIEFPDNIRQLDALVAAGVMTTADGAALQDIYRNFRTRLHHLALDDQPAVVPAGEFLAEREQVTNAWQRWLA